ncbi:hypothetical protein M153_1125000139, partial [Pseudoloma neurophilia]
MTNFVTKCNNSQMNGNILLRCIVRYFVSFKMRKDSNEWKYLTEMHS